MPKTLEHQIESIERTTNVEDAFEVLCKIMLHYGYDKVTYSLLTDHPSLMLPKQHGLANSYPEDWMKHYIANNYLKDDPVANACKTLRIPFYWKDLENDKNTTQKARDILYMGEEAGLKNGMAIPLFGMGGEVSGIGMARSNEEHQSESNYQTLAETNLIANFFHQKFRSLLIEKHCYNVSNKEKDVLSWAAEGKTDDEIAMLMNISRHTVRFHWSRIFTTLESNGRIPSITKAIALGIIEPRFVIGHTTSAS